MHSATSSLPEPLSPMIITVASVGATRWISANTCFIACERPSRLPSPPSCRVNLASTSFGPLSAFVCVEMQILPAPLQFLCNKFFLVQVFADGVGKLATLRCVDG